MPTKARAKRAGGDAEAGAAEAEKSKKVRVTLPVQKMLQTVHQHAAETFADKATELSGVLNTINNEMLRNINWHSNPGNVVLALIHCLTRDRLGVQEMHIEIHLPVYRPTGVFLPVYCLSSFSRQVL